MFFGHKYVVKNLAPNLKLLKISFLLLLMIITNWKQMLISLFTKWFRMRKKVDWLFLKVVPTGKLWKIIKYTEKLAKNVNVGTFFSAQILLIELNKSYLTTKIDDCFGIFLRWHIGNSFATLKKWWTELKTLLFQ